MLSKKSFQDRAKELFKQVFGVPYATKSLIKKNFPWFKGTSESWATLVDELVEISTENDEEIVNEAYKITTQSNFPLNKVFAFSQRTRRMEWIGNVAKNFSYGQKSNSYVIYFSKFGTIGKTVNSYESAIRHLLARVEKEQEARLSLFAC